MNRIADALSRLPSASPTLARSVSDLRSLGVAGNHRQGVVHIGRKNWLFRALEERGSFHVRHVMFSGET
ncbi:hypothetical protein N7516_004148 [Penicillium verrucosum]|uniref:uncharacterized protein n=1 Tax=Penicillium verrucosum TaxID=60171 RepID=UPI0025456723|nr:uncharacterized protein N7516_004148 [Penicillium verrucosum]KAJ5943980.1 hypothetical protein N7516_004148 [Penicillium verrucosum]